MWLTSSKGHVLIRANGLNVPSYIDANPEEQEQDTKSHEERSHEGDQELFVHISSVFCWCHLIADEELRVSKYMQNQQRVRAFGNTPAVTVWEFLAVVLEFQAYLE